MTSCKTLIFFALHSYLTFCYAYKPVVLMHGVFAGPDEFNKVIEWINDTHPGTQTTVIDAYNNLHSLDAMWTQVNNISQTVKKISDQNPGGIHLLCYSQGGLVCRGVIESLPDHNIDTFISLSSPQAGQYGDTSYLKYLFPTYLKESIYELFYTSLGQDVSIANYWNDPHHQDLYVKYSAFSAEINNERKTNNSEVFRKSFQKLKKLVLIGGPDDDVITPWQSSQFSFYDDQEKVIPFNRTTWYQKDMFGLQSLDKRGAIHMHTVSGVVHTAWHSNRTVYDCCIKPWLT